MSAVHLPASLEREAARFAEQDGVSLSHWVSLAVAQKIGAVETAAEFFRRLSHRSATVEEAIAFSLGGPNTPPNRWRRAS
jgi:hypothetical protein